MEGTVLQNLALSTQSRAMSISGMVWSTCQASLLPTTPLPTREDEDAGRPHLNDPSLLSCKHDSSCRFFATGACKFPHKTFLGTQVVVEARDPAFVLLRLRQRLLCKVLAHWLRVHELWSGHPLMPRFPTPSLLGPCRGPKPKFGAW